MHSRLLAAYEQVQVDLPAHPNMQHEVMMTALNPGGNTWETYRVLRAAVQIKLFTISKDPDAEGQPRFQNNRLSALLREDHPNCLKHMVSKGRTWFACLPSGLPSANPPIWESK